MFRKVTSVLLVTWLLVFVLMGYEVLKRNSIYYFPLNCYGWVISQIAPYQIWSNQTFQIPSQSDSAAITVIPPWSHQPYSHLISSIAMKGPQTLVVCSGLDNYIVSHYKSIKGWQRVRRIVVFDGGHHLATLGTAPSMLLIPQTGGYAAHTFMRDAMAVNEIKTLIGQMNTPTVLIMAPRWAVVKCEWGLRGWAERLAVINSRPLPNSRLPLSGCHYTIYGHLALAYLSGTDQVQRLEKSLIISQAHYQKVYLAFNYNGIKKDEAEQIANRWAERLDKQVLIVNQPSTVFSIAW